MHRQRPRRRILCRRPFLCGTWRGRLLRPAAAASIAPRQGGRHGQGAGARMTTQFKQTQSNSWSRTGGAGTQPTTAFSNVEKKASLASVCSGPSGPLPAIWGLSRRFGEACCLRGLADLRLRIVARPTRAPRVERSLESPFHLPVRPRLILPHPWFCRYEHLVQQHQQQKAQSSATAHGMRGRRRRGRRSRAQRHMWHKSAATPREVRARLGPATAHGIGELVAKVGYSRRHGGAPQHR